MRRVSQILLLAMLLAVLSGCSGQAPQDNTSPDLEAANREAVFITAISEETVISHEVILPFAGDDGQENPYYYADAYDGKYVYWVVRAADEQRVAVPVAETTVYHTDLHSGYLEQVAFTYTTSDGEQHDVSQYRLVVATEDLSEGGGES